MAKKPVPKAALRAYRIAKKLTAAQLAKRLGIARTTLRSFENGHRQVHGDMAVKIEKVCGIDRAEIRPDLFVREIA